MSNLIFFCETPSRPQAGKWPIFSLSFMQSIPDLYSMHTLFALLNSELSLYELHRSPQEAITDDTEIAVSPRSLHSELMCPICLDMLKNTYTTKECLHRFCQDCIITALRSGWVIGIFNSMRNGHNGYEIRNIKFILHKGAFTLVLSGLYHYSIEERMSDWDLNSVWKGHNGNDYKDSCKIHTSQRSVCTLVLSGSVYHCIEERVSNCHWSMRSEKEAGGGGGGYCALKMCPVSRRHFLETGPDPISMVIRVE